MGIIRNLLLYPTLKVLGYLAKIENSIFRYTKLKGELGFFAFIRDLLIILTTDLLVSMEDLYKKYPNSLEPIVAYLAGEPSILFRDPKHINTIFESKTIKDIDELEAVPRTISKFTDALGRNLITVEISNWHNMRIRTIKVLGGKYLDHYEKIMFDVMAKELLPQWKNCADLDQPLDLWRSMLTFSSKVVFMSFMGLKADEVPNNIHELLSQLFEIVREIIYSPIVLPKWIPTPLNRNYNDKMGRIRKFIKGYIDSHKASKTMFGNIIRTHTIRKPIEIDDLKLWLEKKDIIMTDQCKDFYLNHQNDDLFYLVSNLITLLGITKTDELQAQIESFLCERGQINEELIFQETISNLIGGSETTIIFMTMSCYFLSQNPECQSSLRQYLQETKDESLTNKINNGYLSWVMNETLRLNPPGPLTNRPIKKPLDLGDFVLEPKFIPWMAGYLVHKDPLIWEHADQFMPERWKIRQTPGSYFPFGSGPRICVGMQYAKREAAVCISTMIENFEISLCDPNYQMIREGNLTLRPKYPVILKLKNINKTH